MTYPRCVRLHEPESDRILDLGESVEIRVEIAGEWRTARVYVARGKLIRRPLPEGQDKDCAGGMELLRDLYGLEPTL